MKYRILILMALGSLAAVGCKKETPAAAETTSQASTGEEPTNRIDIPPTVRSNLGITFAAVERRNVDSTIRIPGAFELQPLARHEYRMTLPGRVELLVDQYQTVDAGDVLYRFRSPEWPELQHEIIVGEQDIDAANAAIAVSDAKLEETEQRLTALRERLSALASAEFRRADLEAQAVELETSLPRLRAERRQAETQLANAHRTREHALHRASAATGIPESRLAAETEHDGKAIPTYGTIHWIDVRAAEAGVVEALAVTDGAFVETPSLVLSTVDPEKVRFRAMALQSDLARIASDASARIVPPAAPGVALSDSVDASLTIGLEAHPDQRTITLIATPQGSKSWIRPGVSAFLEVVAESTGGPALAIPRAAIVKDGIVHVFFRRDPQDPNKAIRVEADMGVNDGRWVAINSGLSLRDEVVLDGAYELKLASQQSGVTQQGGHFHADGAFHDDH